MDYFKSEINDVETDPLKKLRKDANIHKSAL